MDKKNNKPLNLLVLELFLKPKKKLKVLLPFKKDLNPYLEEIVTYTHHTFYHTPYTEYAPSCEIVNIHWPEALFDWLEPTSTELDALEECINEWRRNAVIIYTKHDYRRNKGTTANFTKLFKIVEENTDVFIHLGAYSKRFYEKKYPNAKHEIVYHPIFENTLKVYPKAEARNLLGIDQKALVVIAPGKIRSFKERKMVLKSFKALKHKNKILISTNMRSELKFDFPGRIRLRKYFDVQKIFIKKFKDKYQPPDYIFSYNPLSSRELSIQMSAADVVLVPRLDLLNSGIVFLGFTFGKVTVGPAIGNIQEQLSELNYPVFNPNSISSVIKALEKGIKLNLSGEYIGKSLEKYLPINVASEYDRIFLKYSKR